MLPAIARQLEALDRTQIDTFVESLDDDEALTILSDWGLWQLPYQALPAGEWRRWIFRAGRGTGKTHTGAATTNDVARDRSKIRTGEIGLIGRTHADARHTMVEGPSGILATAPPDFVPLWEPGNGILIWPNGVKGRIYSADKPQGLRGANLSWAWADEPAHWPDLDDIWWKVIEFCLRLGWARCMLTTTPIADPALTKIEADEASVTSRAHTYDNPFLDPELKAIYKRIYEGTRVGRQELAGDILPLNENALWELATIERNRRKHAPKDILRTVIAVDPAVTAEKDSDETGIVAASRGIDDHGYILDDKSGIYKPHGWAKRVAAMFYRWKADAVVAEVNNGGDLVESNIKAIDKRIKVIKVHASRGKVTRAEPVAAMDERGELHHVGEFAKMEDQMCTWDPSKKKSPDRIDARVWAIHELFLKDTDLPGPLRGYL